MYAGISAFIISKNFFYICFFSTFLLISISSLRFADFCCLALTCLGLGKCWFIRSSHLGFAELSEGFPGGAERRTLPAIAADERDSRTIPGSGRCPEQGRGYPLQYSLSENPTDRAVVHRPAKSQTQRKQLSTHEELPEPMNSRPFHKSGKFQYSLPIVSIAPVSSTSEAPRSAVSLSHPGCGLRAPSLPAFLSRLVASY